MSIGQQLKEAREKLGLDERNASERTHIRRHYIIAMEKDDFDSIDLAPVYRIGFLRIYAKLLKLDADALIAEFKANQNPKGSGTRNPFRLSSIKTPAPDGNDTEDNFGQSGFPPRQEPVRTPRKLTVAVVVGTVFLATVASVFALKTCSSDESETDSGAAVSSSIKTTPAYEIEITTNQSQKIVIYEEYKGWDRAQSKPIAGAVILNEFIPAGRPKKITARGTIYIHEEVPQGCQIKYPSKEAFDNAGNANLIPLDANARQMNGRNRTSWLIAPKE